MASRVIGRRDGWPERGSRPRASEPPPTAEACHASSDSFSNSANPSSSASVQTRSSFKIRILGAPHLVNSRTRSSAAVALSRFSTNSRIAVPEMTRKPMASRISRRSAHPRLKNRKPAQMDGPRTVVASSAFNRLVADETPRAREPYGDDRGASDRFRGAGCPVPVPVLGVLAPAFRPVTVTLSEGRQRSIKTCPTEAPDGS